MEEMKNLFTKKEAQEAIKRLVKYFQTHENEEYFGLDDLGIIDIYIETH